MIKIYCVSNMVNGKCYVGKTSHSIEERWKGHIKSARLRPRTYFQNAIRRYGASEFSIVQLAAARTRADADLWERYFIFFFGSNDRDRGYNSTTGGDSGNHTEETKRKLSEISKVNVLCRKHSEETRLKIGAAHKGKVVSAETCKRISDSKKGVSVSKRGQYSEEVRAAISAGLIGNVPWNKGKKCPQLSREKTVNEIEKLRVAITGLKRSEETKEKCRLANLGKVPWNKGKKWLQVAWNKGNKICE